MKPRVLFYVQHLLGVGHVKRAAALARAMEDHGLNVTVALGGPRVSHADFGSAEIRHLPMVRSADASFSALLDENDQPVDDAWRQRRRARLLELYETTRPDILLIELYPFGRRQFRFELLPLLEHASGKSKVFCSVRDVLVHKDNPDRNREIVDIIHNSFDAVFVHGQHDVIPFEDTFPESKAFEELIKYTGYVTEPSPKSGRSEAGKGEVVVSIGGGAVGAPLMRTALDARAISVLSGRTWRFLAGDNLEESIFQELRNNAPDGVIVERARPDFRQLLMNAELSISQGGYNTVMDILAAGCPSVVVPFAEGNESEQTYRARIFADMGLLHLLEADQLSAESLAQKIDEAIRAGRPESAKINLSGAETTANLITELT
jgi:predicted glycosyltransferase